MVIESNLTPFERTVHKNLLAAQARLHSKVDRLVKFDCLSKIISHCRQLQCDPVPFLKDPLVADKRLEVSNETVFKCPHCEFTTSKGVMSMRAHFGRKHPNIKFVT